MQLLAAFSACADREKGSQQPFTLYSITQTSSRPAVSFSRTMSCCLQVFYHLGELDSALTYALGAGAHFNVDEQSEYVQTLIGK